jgi:hypothetical protein
MGVTEEAQSVRRTEEEAPAETQEGEMEQGGNAPHCEGGCKGGETTPEQVATILLESDDLEGGIGGKPDASKEDAGKAPEAHNVQARGIINEVPVVTPREAAGIDSLRGGGQPLPSASRTFFEPYFGKDLGRVRIHTGGPAGQLAHDIRAEAFTVGSDIVFGEGRFSPTSQKGKWLLAHELTHVLQQEKGQPRTRGADINRHRSGGDRLQRSILGKVWGGIKKAGRALWREVKRAAGAVWGGARWLLGGMWGAMKEVGKWSWNVLKSGAALAWSLVVDTPSRIWRLLKHLGSGIAGVAGWMVEGFKLAWRRDFKKMGEWILSGLKSGAAWVLRLLGKLSDIAGVGEIWDLLSQIIKFNTRPLTDGEIVEAKVTFANSISYWKVRVDEYSLISTIGAAVKKEKYGMGVTTFHTVNFNQKITATAGSSDMHWLTHELTHVSQGEHVGSQYLGEAVHAQSSEEGYDYGGQYSPLWRPAKSPSPHPSGLHFRAFNREQQASIAADYYYSRYGVSVRSGKTSFLPDPEEYEPVIDELRKGDM